MSTIVTLVLAGLVTSISCELLRRSRRKAAQVVEKLRLIEMDLAAANRRNGDLNAALDAQVLLDVIHQHGETADERLASIVNSSEDAIIGIDLSGLIISWNKGAERIFGYLAAEMVGASMMRLLPEDREEEDAGIIARIQRGEDIEHYETLRQTRTGRMIDVSISVSRIKDATGKTIGVSKIARDVSVRKRAEKRLKLLETCMEHTTDLVIITDVESTGDSEPRILFVNKAFVNRTGYSFREAIGRPLTFLHGPKTSQAELERIREAMLQRKPIRSELIHYTKAGEEFWIEINIAPVPDDTHWVTNWVAIGRDVTVRKYIEQSIQSRQSGYRALFEQMPEAMMTAGQAC